MAANNQFSIAVHLMAGLGYCPEGDATSANLAHSVNTSASFVRRTLAKLSRAGLVETSKGKNGFCRLARKAEKISLRDIYEAVDAPRVFSIHHYEAQRPCAVSCNIKAALEKVLGKTQKAAEKTLAGISLADVISDLKQG